MRNMRQITISKIKNTIWYNFVATLQDESINLNFDTMSDREVLDKLVFAEIFSHDQKTHAGCRF